MLELGLVPHRKRWNIHTLCICSFTCSTVKIYVHKKTLFYQNALERWEAAFSINSIGLWCVQRLVLTQVQHGQETSWQLPSHRSLGEWCHQDGRGQDGSLCPLQKITMRQTSIKESSPASSRVQLRPCSLTSVAKPGEWLSTAVCLYKEASWCTP